jgi:4-oxalocrotonate tautomerase
MPIVTVQMWEGRTEEQKQAVAKGITKLLQQECNAKPEATIVIFEDIAKSNWATNGVIWSIKDKLTRGS